MLHRPLVPKGEAVAVADVLHTVAALREAAATAAKLKRGGKSGQWPIVSIEAEERAKAYVRELTERVQSRARAAGVEANDLIRMSEAVLDQRMILPSDVEVVEPA